MIKVLFVCTGNICRSPTAEGVFRHLVETAGLSDKVDIDSAGTHSYHVGAPPDPRTVMAARARGIDLSPLRARVVRPGDFAAFDLILAMDSGHLAHLEAMSPAGGRAKVKLFLDYHPEGRLRDVPDPYYGGPAGFEHVFDLVEHASRALLAKIVPGTLN
jgi:protein-tyrosine phosphatase